MGPRTGRNSTRARKAPSANSRSKLRKPTARNRSNLRHVARAPDDQRKRQVDAILNAARAAEPALTAADALKREQRLLRPAAGALRQIRDQLELACSCAIVVEHALTNQNCDLDDDAALVLKRHVGDELGRQIERINLLLGVPSSDLDEGTDNE